MSYLLDLQPHFGPGSLRAQLPIVKQLFLSGQYRHCSIAATALLRETSKDEPHIHVAYLHFYAGISFHELSRNMHLLNDQRQTSLENAEWHYTAAIAALSVLTARPELETIHEVSSYSEDDDSMADSTSPHRASFQLKRSSIDSASTDDSTSLYSDDGSEPAFSSTPKAFFRSPPSRKFLDDLSLSSQRLTHKPPPCATSCSALTAQTEQFNVNLTAFVNLMHSHIDDCHSLLNVMTAPAEDISQGWHPIANTTTAARYSGTAKSTPTAAPLRGRAKLLPRKRFNPKKYEDLCRKALAEI